MSYRGRFAPSPTGPLHFGSLVAAVGSWLRARANQGVWLIRMEDIDPPREVPGAAEDILATLAAFGMESDEPVLYQSRREPAYREALERLRADSHAFPCWCSRGDLEAQRNIHHEPCSAPADPARPPAWRMRVPHETIHLDDTAVGSFAQDLHADAGDFVILRNDGWFAYQLAVVVDDAYQSITEVVRGLDLLDSTPRQIYLQRLLGYPTPAYLHLPLVLDADGRKLSKQERARSIDRNDPMPGLREALRFLGVDSVPRATSAAKLLHGALHAFDLAGIKKKIAASEQSGNLRNNRNSENSP